MGSSEAFEAGGESVEHLIVVSSILEHVVQTGWFVGLEEVIEAGLGYRCWVVVLKVVHPNIGIVDILCSYGRERP